MIRFFTPSLFVPDTSELPCQMNYFERKTRKMYLQAVAYLALCLQSAAETWFSLLANKTTLKETRHLTSVSACDRSDISEKGPRTQFEALTHNYTQLHTDTTGDASDGFSHPSSSLTGHGQIPLAESIHKVSLVQHGSSYVSYSQLNLIILRGTKSQKTAAVLLL